MTMNRICVSSATSFTSEYLINQLLSQGHRVVALTKKTYGFARSQYLYQLAKTYPTLQIVCYNPLDYNSVYIALKGCNIAYYMGFPFRLTSPRDRYSLQENTKQCALNFLKAAHAHSIERVIWTSSVFALVDTTLVTERLQRGGNLINEMDWNETANFEQYPFDCICKVVEMMVWEYTHQHDIEIVMIVSGVPVGPLLWARKTGPSVLLLTRLLAGTLDVDIARRLIFVDVRTLNNAYVKAMELDGITNKRYIVADKYLISPQEVSHMLHKVYKNVPNFVGSVHRGERIAVIDNQKVQKWWKIELGDTMNAILEMADSMIAKGVVANGSNITSYSNSRIAPAGQEEKTKYLEGYQEIHGAGEV